VGQATTDRLPNRADWWMATFNCKFSMHHFVSYPVSILGHLTLKLKIAHGNMKIV
jgi:hypothetical protein